MTEKHLYTAIGLMSGTSLDGIDAALIRTDGAAAVEVLGFHTASYDPTVRGALRACLGQTSDPDGRVAKAAEAMTLAHAGIVHELLHRMGLEAADIDLIGFHGQTVFHDPDRRFTWQIGDGALLAARTGIRVINDFRSADVKAGGQGAPLLPLYHRARVMAGGLPRPVAILNIGGVANLTWIGAGEEDILAFDTGPGNALVNDWVRQREGFEFDDGGRIAAGGSVHNDIIAACLDHPYFTRKPPKSLDRDMWSIACVDGLSTEDGAATLAAFTVRAVLKSLDHLPERPKSWHVTGGGRHNPVLMDDLRSVLGVPVGPVDDLGWNGDALEAEGFAYLAVRSHLGLPVSLPATTGVPEPVTGGVSWLP